MITAGVVWKSLIIFRKAETEKQESENKYSNLEEEKASDLNAAATDKEQVRTFMLQWRAFEWSFFFSNLVLK